MALSNIRIVGPNTFDLVSPQASPALAAATPAANLQSSLRGKVVRSTSRVDQIFTGNWATAYPMQAIALIKHNLVSPHCTWQVELFSAINQANLVYDSGAVSIISPLDWTRSTDVIWLSQSYSPLSFRLTLHTGNASYPAEGFFEVGRLYMGPIWTPATNMSYDGFNCYWEDNTKQVRTGGGSVRTEAGPSFRVLSVSLDTLTETERWTLMELARQIGKRQDLFVSAMYDASLPYQSRDTMFAAKIVDMPKLGIPYPDSWQASLTMEET